VINGVFGKRIAINTIHPAYQLRESCFPKLDQIPIDRCLIHLVINETITHLREGKRVARPSNHVQHGKTRTGHAQTRVT